MITDNITAIARWAGVSRGALYEWRKTRPVVYRAIIEKYRRENP